ncbi:MAG: sugar ABC transporter permease, partial [Candidatus Mariimomonas ferrooxydans]
MKRVRTALTSIFKNRVYYLFLLPFYVFFIYFLVIPAGKVFYYSLFQINNVGFKLTFDGLENYRNIFSDFRFWAALKNTSLLVVILIPMVVVVSLFIANSIYREKQRLKTFVRAAIYIPAITAEIVLIMTWKYIYNPRVGLLNYILSFFKIPPQDWLGSPTLAPLALTLVVLTFSLGAPSLHTTSTITH